ncbi:FAD-dependent monooxygenase [Roseateles paludis]|jgi:2-polyprenyl-6-methoxyphenol hydroxylase-like FAD-dependent oxidoreductase|uniref:FAD-dependent monooxygenase n=1 Tax=Roseateles paludis TaxID=3145238 RepID=A0ABV0G6A2_9BURK
MQSADANVDVLIRGAGAVGSSLALALSAQGLSVALLGREEAPRGPDVRTYALNASAVSLLRELRVWDALPPEAIAPVYDMWVAGDAPGARLDFSAWQQGVSELAFIVDAGALDEQLAAALRFAPRVTRVREPVSARLTALCEGRDSASRQARGVEFAAKAYGHHGVAARLASDQPHQGVARQWFRAPDVLALLPFNRPEPGASHGLVWSVPAERAEALLAMPPEDFERELNDATQGSAGRLQLGSERAAWPLMLAAASEVSGEGWVLLGDAAHLVHPLAGQGLNLGLADVACLARVLAAREPWRGLGDARLLRRFARERYLPNLAMGQLTDALQRLFASDAGLVREARNRGLTALNHLPPLKRWLTQRALGL